MDQQLLLFDISEYEDSDAARSFMDSVYASAASRANAIVNVAVAMLGDTTPSYKKLVAQIVSNTILDISMEKRFHDKETEVG